MFLVGNRYVCYCEVIFYLQCETISRKFRKLVNSWPKPSSTQPVFWFCEIYLFFFLPIPSMCLVSHQVPFLVGRQDCWCHRSGFTIAQRSVPNLSLFHSRVLKRVSLFRENSWSINVCPWLVAGSKLKAYARRKREAKPSKRKKRRAHWAILPDAIRRI